MGRDNQNIDMEGVRVTHPEKVLYPAAEVTKEELAGYFCAVAPRMLPYIENRPLSLVRCPSGVESTCFFQKHPGSSLATVPTTRIRELQGTADYALVRSAADLVKLAQANVIEVHTWLSTAMALDNPDHMVLDLDPGPGVPWRQCIDAASIVRKLLDELGLTSFARLSGGKGVHVVTPIVPEHSWDTMKQFAHHIADALSLADPSRFVSQSSKAKRRGRIYVDYLRNDRGSTAVANYSPRARSEATVAVPVGWEELKKSYGSGAFTIRTVVDRLKRQRNDPWRGYFTLKQHLAPDSSR